MKRFVLLNLPPNPKILIVRFSSLGDVTLASAVLPPLRAAYPGARLSFLTKTPYGELLSGVPELDEVLTLNPGEGLLSLARRVKSFKFDLMIDLHGNLRSKSLHWLLLGLPCVRTSSRRWQRQALVWFKVKPRQPIPSAVERYAEALKSLGLDPKGSCPKLSLNGMALDTQERFGLSKLKKPIIGFSLSSRHPTKKWNVQSAAACMAKLRAMTGGSIVLIGNSRDDSEEPGEGDPTLNLVGKTSLAELAAVLASFSVLVTVDSGPLHMAEALGVPVVALFGPTVAEFGFAPLHLSSRRVEIPLPCRPCSLHGGKACPLGHHRCMGEISAERVVQETLSVMAGRA